MAELIGMWVKQDLDRTHPELAEAVRARAFLQYLDQLTPLHVKIVLYFHDPAGWLDRMGLNFPYTMSGPDQGLEVGIPELVEQRAIYGPMVDDLHYKGLIAGDRQFLGTLMSKSAVLGKRTTLIGDKFLRYIGMLD